MVHRTSISLDPRTQEKIKQIVSRTGKSVSEVVREAVNLYYTLEYSSNLPETSLKTYIDFLSEGEHVIVDLEHWCAIWNELNDKAGDDFWEMIAKSGYEHGIQYYNKGLRDVKSILDYMEPGNFFRYKEDSDGSFTLILSCPSEIRFLKVFLENILKAQNIDAEIRESIGKLRIVLK